MYVFSSPAICPAGKEFSSSTKTCKECSLGYYKNQTGNSDSCQKCPVGYTTSSTGSIHPKNCSVRKQCLFLCCNIAFPYFDVKNVLIVTECFKLCSLAQWNKLLLSVLSCALQLNGTSSDYSQTKRHCFMMLKIFRKNIEMSP